MEQICSVHVVLINISTNLLEVFPRISRYHVAFTRLRVTWFGHQKDKFNIRKATKSSDKASWDKSCCRIPGRNP